MRATAEDLPSGTAASGTVAAAGRRGGILLPEDGTPPTPGDAARAWLNERLTLPDGAQATTSTVGFLCLQRAVVALETAQAAAPDPQAASMHLAIADQYRQLAAVCGERGGSALAPPRGRHDDLGSRIR